MIPGCSDKENWQSKTSSWEPKLLIIHFLAMSCNEWLEWTTFLLMSEIDSNVKSTSKDNICATYHFKEFFLDE